MRNKTRIVKDKLAQGIMLTITVLAILLVAVIAVGLYLKSKPVLEESSLWTLLFSSEWRPMKGAFGFLPFIMGTVWVTLLSILIALP
ncbi:MAG: phosphate ABC transporter permease subunit PstC, partial [Bacteroidetes bacterium]|nr:phosphate ABC transporter permease subunit PstC [Bacteroidota bacterium]